MKKIVILKGYDLYLTYSWSSINHGICGHTYEVLDYYLLLKDHFKVAILLCEDITWETFKNAIEDKYELSDQELLDIENNTIFRNRPKLLKGSNILFCDGSVNSINQVTLFFDNIFMFGCGYRTPRDYKKGIILQDDRLYPQGDNTINYVKKINFDKYKSKVNKSDTILLYGTKNCRLIGDDTYDEILAKYDNEILCLVNEITEEELYPQITFAEMPYKDLFNKFGTYIYTPVPRKWDCSPRFIAECKFYDKKVVYHNIDYWDEDDGLRVRKEDIRKNFDSLFLKSDDPIIEILNSYIK